MAHVSEEWQGPPCPAHHCWLLLGTTGTGRPRRDVRERVWVRHKAETEGHLSTMSGPPEMN